MSTSNGTHKGSPALRFKYVNGGSVDVDQSRLAVSSDRTDTDQRFIKPFARKEGGGLIEKSLGVSSESSYLSQLFLNLGGEETLSRPYIESPWVNACIRAIVRAELKVKHRWRNGPEDTDEQMKLTGQLAGLDRLLRRPNPNLTGRELRTLTTTYDQLFGESFWFLMASNKLNQMVPVAAVKGSGPSATIQMPEEVWIVRGEVVELILNEETQMPQAWAFYTKKGRIEFPAHAVFQPKQIDPYNPLRGLGPMQAAYRAASQDFTAERFDEALLNNGGQPGGVYKAKGAVTREQVDELRAAHAENFAKPISDRQPLVLGGDLDYNPLAHSPRDMELQDKRAANKRTILGVFGVPSPVLAHTEDVQNRSVAETALRVFWINTVGPHLDWYEEQVNEGLIHRIEGAEDVWLWFDRSPIEVLRPDIPQMVKDVTELQRHAGRSWNEAIEIVGLGAPEKVEGGDERFISVNMTPAGLVEDIAKAQIAGAGDPENTRTGKRSEGKKPEAKKPKPDKEPKAPPPQTAPRKSDPELETRTDDSEDVDPESFGDDAPDLTKDESAWAKGMDVEARAAYFERVNKELIPHDERVAEKISPVMTRWLRDVGRRMRSFAKAGKSLMADPDTFERGLELATKQSTSDVEKQLAVLIRVGMERFERDFIKAVSGSFDATWDVAANSIAREIGFVEALDHTSPEAIKFLNARRLSVSSGVMLRFSNHIREAVMRTMLAEGVRTGTLASRLREVDKAIHAELVNQSRSIEARALVVAVTENTVIANRARAAEMLKDGVSKHMWITRRDLDVRDSHITLDGRIRAVGKLFGFGLRWPGDSRARAEQIVNCRCFTAPIPRQG